MAAGRSLVAGALLEEARVVLGGGSLANDAQLSNDGERWSIQGDPTDAAFLVAEQKAGWAQARTQRFRRVAELPFTSERKLMSTLAVDGARGQRVIITTKGAPDVLLSRCSHEQVGRDVQPLTAERRATQVLWINLLTDTAPALALEVDAATDDVMRRRPRSADARIIDREMQLGVLFVGVVMALCTLLTLDMKLPGGFIEGSSSPTQARTSAFTVLVLAQLFNCFNSRSEHSAFRGMFSNPLLWAAIGASVVLQVSAVSLPVLNAAFGTETLSFRDWLICIGMASPVLWADELKKVLVRLARRRTNKTAVTGNAA